MSDAHTRFADLLQRQSRSGADFDGRHRQPFLVRVSWGQTFHERQGLETGDENVVAG